MSNRHHFQTAFFLSVILISTAAYSEDYVITLKDRQFSPQNLEIPARQKTIITVKNQQSFPAEFESSDLNREKLIAANSEIKVFLGPLNPGTYKYYDDFHRETTATITVK
jgi:hypothetical protein